MCRVRRWKGERISKVRPRRAPVYAETIVPVRGVAGERLCVHASASASGSGGKSHICGDGVWSRTSCGGARSRTSVDGARSRTGADGARLRTCGGGARSRTGAGDAYALECASA